MGATTTVQSLKNQQNGRAVASPDVSSLVGNTPLVRIRRIAAGFPSIEFYAKLEGANPGGSVKDRPALNIIREGERTGELKRDKTLIDATSGNTGIAYAMVGAARGYRVKLFMPSNASPERKRILKAYGVELVLTDPMEGTDGAIRKVREVYSRNPDTYFYANQYDNPANWQAHYNSTAVEIHEQTEGRVTHFVAGLGTSGTFMGTSRRLKELAPGICCISLQPDSPLHGLEGMKHMATAIVPKIYDPELADENLEVATEDAQQMALRLVREEGLLVGTSSGAAMVGILKVAQALSEAGSSGGNKDSNDPQAVIVTVFPDGGDKYLSERFWNEG